MKMLRASAESPHPRPQLPGHQGSGHHRATRGSCGPAGVVPAGAVRLRPSWRGLGEAWAWSWMEPGRSPAETGQETSQAGVGAGPSRWMGALEVDRGRALVVDGPGCHG